MICILPMFLHVKEYFPLKPNQNVQFYIDYLRNMHVSIEPFEKWTSKEILFSIFYICILTFLINFKLHYKITDKGIYYTVFGGIFMVSFYPWDEIVCYDIDNLTVSLWVSPPIFKPDWTISISKHEFEKVNETLSKFAVLYSVKKNDKYIKTDLSHF
ncbi:hypothetical protein D3C80_1611310 [compost metagenome]